MSVRVSMEPAALWCPALLTFALLHTVASSRIEDQWRLKGLNRVSLNHMVMDTQTDKLYVAAVNKLFVFDGDLQSPYEVQTGPQEDNVKCASHVVDQSTPCANISLTPVYNKGLVIDYTNKRLITCTNLFQGTCEKRYLDNILYKEDDNSKLIPVVNNDPKASTVLFIAPGPHRDGTGDQTDVLYVGAQPSRLGLPDINEHVPVFASRLLRTLDLVNNDLAGGRRTGINLEYGKRNASTFSVHYKYGFSSQGFSYMIVVQKANTTAENFISKLVRVCQNDWSFTSYAEVPLQCEAGGVVYNLAQAAYLGRPGSSLARRLGVPTTEDVLYAVFSKSFGNSAKPLTQSALCVYTMRSVRRKFTKNIRACFKGHGNTGPAHFAAKHEHCLKTSLKVSNDYCGEHGVNTPIDGSLPVTAVAAVTFNVTATAITVVDGQNDTQALVGTADGHLLKVILESQTAAELYDDVILDEGARINADMILDSNNSHVYVMTDTKVLKVNVRDWQKPATCRECGDVTDDPDCDLCDVSKENEESEDTVADSHNSSRRPAVSSLSLFAVLILWLYTK